VADPRGPTYGYVYRVGGNGRNGARKAVDGEVPDVPPVAPARSIDPAIRPAPNLTCTRSARGLACPAHPFGCPATG
jgi:hypothetical protein